MSSISQAGILIRTAMFMAVLPLVAVGTPDHVVRVEERLLGSNPEGFITLRTEVDNLGSYYKARSKRILVEYSKLPADPESEGDLGAEVRSTLLLDVTVSINPDDPANTTEVVDVRNEEVQLAELLLRFPDQPRRWTDEKAGSFECDPKAGLRFGRVPVAWGGWIKARFGVDRNSDLDWTLDEVFEDENCLYFGVNTEDHGRRLVSIPSRKTRQVRDHMHLQPVYLVAGKFENLEEAVKKGRELVENTEGKFKPEVWSSGRWEAEMVYVLVDSDSAEHIEGDAFESLEAMTGVQFTVMSSELFDERFAIEP